MVAEATGHDAPRRLAAPAPVVNTVRGLLLGTPIGNSLVLAITYSLTLALVGYLWTRAIYNR